jgi:type IV pilus assembly protein PilV
MPRLITINSRRQAGFSMIEAMIAILIFSIGLIGMAGLMLVSVRTNQSAYLRTQASFLAQSLVDRIRANRGQVLAYNGTYAPLGAATDPCAGGAVCDPAAQVNRDKLLWRQQLGQFLPNASANVLCAGTVLGSVAQQGASPFNGTCSLQIQWAEATLDKSDGAAPLQQTFAWVFQP